MIIDFKNDPEMQELRSELLEVEARATTLRRLLHDLVLKRFKEAGAEERRQSEDRRSIPRPLAPERRV